MRWNVIRNFVMSTVLAALLLSQTACALLQGGLGLESPKVTVSNISMQGATLFEQQFVVTLRVNNPNNSALPITGLRYQLALNGNEFAEGATASEVSIPALGEALVDVTLTTSTFNLMRQMSDWRNGLPEVMDYQIKGKLFLAGALVNSLPFSRSGQVDLQSSTRQ